MECRRLAAVALAAIAMGAFRVGAIGPADTRVTGSFDANSTSGIRHGEFTCFGMPLCSGTVTVQLSHGGCSNNYVYTTDWSLSGLDLSRIGSFTGTLTAGNKPTHTFNSDGTCTYHDTSGASGPYGGTWNGTSGTLQFTSIDGSGNPVNGIGVFSANVAAASPVFPMVVTGSITPTVANARADIQPRPADVGSQASIFVFAHAPANMLKDAPAKRAVPAVGAMTADDAVICVLAQVNGQGQLVAVSASTMQAYLTGVLGSQTQAVTILSNVSTPNVAGATFFVGYGPSATGMLTSGNYQSAITIPGGVQCSSSLAAAPAPTTPGALTGLWWNAAESGWGVHFTQRGANVFAAWYTYDSSGNPKWYVSTCTGFTGASGTCNGALLQVVGPSFFGTGSFNTSLVNATNAGTLQVSFSNPNSASMTYTVGGQTRTVSLTRQPLGTGTTTPAVDYTDLWWGGTSESGWGMAMAQQYGVNFLAWYVYDANGRPTWLVATCIMSGSSCTGTLYRTVGPAFGPTFNSSLVQATAAGTVLVIFTDANNGILTYTVDGVTATKSVTRQIF